MTKTKKQSRLTEALLEAADDLHKSGLMNDADYNRITLRHLGKEKIPTAKQVTAEETRKMRARRFE